MSTEDLIFAHQQAACVCVSGCQKTELRDLQESEMCNINRPQWCNSRGKRLFVEFSSFPVCVPTKHEAPNHIKQQNARKQSQQKREKWARPLFRDVWGTSRQFHNFSSATFHRETHPEDNKTESSDKKKKKKIVFLAESSIFSRSHIRIRKQLWARGTGGSTAPSAGGSDTEWRHGKASTLLQSTTEKSRVYSLHFLFCRVSFYSGLLQWIPNWGSGPHKRSQYKSEGSQDNRERNISF